jgi:hypothetical protein
MQRNELLLLYPTPALTGQVGLWVGRDARWSLRTCEAGGPAEIRRAAGEAGLVLIDATDRPALAASALSHVLTVRRPVAVYTEIVHEGLELYVRVRGVLLLLGPMPPASWRSFFRRNLVGLREPSVEPGDREWDLSGGLCGPFVSEAG